MTGDPSPPGAPSNPPMIRRSSTDESRTRVHPLGDLIRSGQDWTDADGDQRALHLNDVEPALRTGMNSARFWPPIGRFGVDRAQRSTPR